jgi:hypothetical protein
MSTSFGTWVALGRRSDDPSKEVGEQARFLLPRLGKLFKVKVVSARRAIPGVEGSEEAPDPSGILRGEGDGPRWEPTQLIVDLSHGANGRSFGHTLYMPADDIAFYGVGVDSTLPPRLSEAVSCAIVWDDRFLDGRWLKDTDGQKFYRRTMELLLHEVAPLRLMDGYRDYPDDWRQEITARFVHYKDPEVFVRSFLLATAGDGSVRDILGALREWAADGALEEAARMAAAPEEPFRSRTGEFDPFKPLRFTAEGGVILEKYRLFPARPDFSGASPPLYELLFRMLQKKRIVRDWRNWRSVPTPG